MSNPANNLMTDARAEHISQFTQAVLLQRDWLPRVALDLAEATEALLLDLAEATEALLLDRQARCELMTTAQK